jgi:hypothetical protein
MREPAAQRQLALLAALSTRTDFSWAVTANENH